MKKLLLSFIIIPFMSGCVTFKNNPAYTDCVNGCREKKNGCMINASTTEMVNGCDQSQKKCMEKCSAIPAVIRAE